MHTVCDDPAKRIAPLRVARPSNHSAMTGASSILFSVVDKNVCSRVRADLALLALAELNPRTRQYRCYLRGLFVEDAQIMRTQLQPSRGRRR
jgi:hypothetical protein